MLRLNLLPILLILTLITYTFLGAKEINYTNSSYPKFKNNDFKWINLDDENAEFKIEKKQESFNYALKSKLGKYGYEDSDFTDSYITTLYNEDLYRLLFSSSFYLDDDVWLNFNTNYKDSSTSTITSIGGLAYEKKSIKQESNVKLFYKPNSILVTNLSFENINKTIDYDKFLNKNLEDSNSNKLSLNVNTKFDSFTLNSSFFQIIKDNNYSYRSTVFDDYLTTSQELYKGIELSLSKQLSEDLKVTTSGKLTSVETLDSNLSNLIGKTPTNTPNKELNMKVEYLFKDIKLISKVTHVGSRYSDNLNNDKLDSYTIESVGAIFFTQINNEDVKIDFNVKNLLNKDYYLYSDTKGDSRNYMINLSMEF